VGTEVVPVVGKGTENPSIGHGPNPSTDKKTMAAVLIMVVVTIFIVNLSAVRNGCGKQSVSFVLDLYQIDLCLSCSLREVCAWIEKGNSRISLWRN
jgi:hypothetical protein